MPRTARLDIHCLLYHVIVRGIELRPIVSEGITTEAPEPERAKGLRRRLAGQIGKGDDLAADDRVLDGETFWQGMHPEAENPTAMPLPVLLNRVATAFDVTPEHLLRRTRVLGVARCFVILQRIHGGTAGRRLHEC